MHPLLAMQLDLARHLIDAAARPVQAMADGMVALQAASARTVATPAGDRPARPDPVPVSPFWWMAAASPPFNPFLAWQSTLAQMMKGAAPALDMAGTHSVAVRVAVRSASGHAMAFGIEMPATPGSGRR